MGCDIHSFVEVKRKGKWVAVKKVASDWYDAEDEPNDYKHPFSKHPISNRNYDLFAILANVRNGSGFAGCDTGDGFEPISMPRDLPADVSPEVKRESDRMGEDGHSHSWLKLRELLDDKYWQKTTKHRGWVNVFEYSKFKQNGKPSGWCGGVSGGNVKHVTNKQMDALLQKNIVLIAKVEAMKSRDDLSKTEQKKLDAICSTYTQVEWTESYKESVGKTFFTVTIPALKRLSSLKLDWKNEFTDVRIVFWFDN